MNRFDAVLEEIEVLAEAYRQSILQRRSADVIGVAAGNLLATHRKMLKLVDCEYSEGVIPPGSRCWRVFREAYK